MSLILGIDPGQNGAFAVYDSEARRLVSVREMPVWYQQFGKNKRKRVDPIGLAEMFEAFKLMGVTLAVLESVGGRPQQGAQAAYVFGYGVGLIYMCLVVNQIPIETVLPQSWKAILRVPGKMKADDTAIMQRAYELFPEDRDMFRGERGGKRVDVAEAAMLAMFGGDEILKAHRRTRDVQADLNAYQKV